MKTYNQIFSENLNALMRRDGISQNGLGRLLGLSASTVNLWCTGRSIPRANKMDKLCELFGVTQAELTTDKDTIPNLSVPSAHPLSILGSICAGDGILAEQNFDGYFFVDNSIRADYCLRVEGDSMNDAHIYHGDIAFIRKSYGFIDGGIYAVVYGENENAVLKKVYRQDDSLLLMPCNQKYNPVSVKDNYLIVGECVGIYHPKV